MHAFRDDDVRPTMIFHKAFADISELAQQYSGSEFWAALAWKVIWNIAAGS